MKHLYTSILVILMAMAFAPANAIDRQHLAQYAQSLKGLKKASLKQALTKLMNDKHVLAYGSGAGKTWSGFYKTDRDPQTNECYNRYSSKKFYFSGGNKNRAISGMNIEHSFPKSWWGGGKNDAYKDLYNLYPSDQSANSSKSNYPMDDVSNGAPNPGFDKVGSGAHTSRAWEPGDRYKGDFSRSYMYMGVTYAGLTFSGTGSQTMDNNSYPGMKTWATTLYRKWSKNDKVDELEVKRNNAVASIQSNRNLFIDYPFLAEYVWGDSVDVAFNPETSITTASDDSRYGSYTPDEGGDDKPDKGDDVNPDETDDVYYFVKLTTEPTSGKRYLIVVNNNGSLQAAKPHSRKYDYLKTDAVKETNGTIKMNSTADAFTFEEAGDGFYIKGSDNNYYYNDQKHYNFNRTTTASSAYVWTVEKQSDGTFIIKNGENIILYNTKYKNFAAYKSYQSGNLYPYLYEEQKQTTGIDNHSVENHNADNDAIYTLQGIRVNTTGKLQPGIYIRGGKKFVVR